MLVTVLFSVQVLLPQPAAQIPVADAPAPAVVGREGQLLERHVEVAAVEVVARLGFRREPGARLEGERGVKVVQGGLAGLGIEPPVELQIPVHQLVQLAVALGLERVAQAEADDVLRVHGINVVVVGKRHGQLHEARLFAVELRQLAGGVLGSGTKT